MHLVVDGYGGDAEALKNTELIYDFLDTLPDRIGMTKIIPPQVYTYHGEKSRDWGVSGFVLIAESHISIHTFPDREHVNIDIFSCQSFDQERALAEAKDLIQLQVVKTWVLDRGLEWLDSRQGLAETQEQRTVLESGRLDRPRV